MSHGRPQKTAIQPLQSRLLLMLEESGEGYFPALVNGLLNERTANSNEAIWSLAHLMQELIDQEAISLAQTNFEFLVKKNEANGLVARLKWDDRLGFWSWDESLSGDIPRVLLEEKGRQLLTR